jgi:anaerobic glycerol-3-phosphate dehydrogenase
VLIAASLPISFQVLGWLLAAVIGCAAIYGGYYLAKSRRAAAALTLADSAVNSMTATNADLTVRVDLLERDHKHCLEGNAQRDAAIAQMNKQHDTTVEQMNKRITDLREDVTQRALVAEFRDEARGFLTAIADKLDIEVTAHPPLPPTV